MTRRWLYLARHGETAWNRANRWQGHTDVALNEVGRQQARALAEIARNRGIALVHASDLGRARETAEIVAAALGVPGVVIDPGLRERGFGCFEGLTREECMAQFPHEWATYKSGAGAPPPGGEVQAHVVERMRDAMLRAATALQDEPSEDAAALAVSHGGSIRLLVGSITGEVPPPLENGALFSLEVLFDGAAGTFGAVSRIK